jgi:hypothetical protein
VNNTLFFDIVNDRNRSNLNNTKKHTHQDTQVASSSVPNGGNERFTFWGYKFEEACTKGNDPRFADLGPVNPNNQFCAVFKIKFNDMRCIIAAEIDCYEVETRIQRSHGDHTDPLAPPAKQRVVEQARYLELKTSKIVSTDRDDFVFKRHKLLSFWIQSYLVDTRTIIVGFRDETGVVRKIERLDVSSIPAVAGDLWNPRACLNCGFDVIATAKKFCCKENTVYSLEYGPPFTAIRLTETNLAPFLPQEFVVWMNGSRKS